MISDVRECQKLPSAAIGLSSRLVFIDACAFTRQRRVSYYGFLHMRSGYQSHSGVAGKLFDCCLWSVSLPFVVVAGVCYVLALLSRVVRSSS